MTALPFFFLYFSFEKAAVILPRTFRVRPARLQPNPFARSPNPQIKAARFARLRLRTSCSVFGSTLASKIFSKHEGLKEFRDYKNLEMEIRGTFAALRQLLENPKPEIGMCPIVCWPFSNVEDAA